MLASQIPTKFPIPFGNSAATGTIRTVPVADQTTTSPGAASLTTGFPPATGQPLASGGIPPAMQDFNGLFNQITAWNRWQNAGATVLFDQSFCTAIGGYPQGAVLASTIAGNLWLNLVDNNTTNPDSGSSAGWVGIANLKQTPKGQTRTSKFTPNVVLTDLPSVGTPYPTQTVTISGATYVVLTSYVGVRNNQSLSTGVISYITNSAGGTSQYLGCVVLNGVQIPLPIRATFVGLSPAQTYTFTQVVQKDSAVGPILALDAYLLAEHDGN